MMKPRVSNNYGVDIQVYQCPFVQLGRPESPMSRTRGNNDEGRPVLGSNGIW